MITWLILVDHLVPVDHFKHRQCQCQAATRMGRRQPRWDSRHPLDLERCVVQHAIHIHYTSIRHPRESLQKWRSNAIASQNDHLMRHFLRLRKHQTREWVEWGLPWVYHTCWLSWCRSSGEVIHNQTTNQPEESSQMTWEQLNYFIKFQECTLW